MTCRVLAVSRSKWLPFALALLVAPAARATPLDAPVLSASAVTTPVGSGGLIHLQTRLLDVGPAGLSVEPGAGLLVSSPQRGIALATFEVVARLRLIAGLEVELLGGASLAHALDDRPRWVIDDKTGAHSVDLGSTRALLSSGVGLGLGLDPYGFPAARVFTRARCAYERGAPLGDALHPVVQVGLSFPLALPPGG